MAGCKGKVCFGSKIHFFGSFPHIFVESFEINFWCFSGVTALSRARVLARQAGRTGGREAPHKIQTLHKQIKIKISSDKNIKNLNIQKINKPGQAEGAAQKYKHCTNS